MTPTSSHLIVGDLLGTPVVLTPDEFKTARQRAAELPPGLIGPPASPNAATRIELVDAETAARQLGITARWLEDMARQGIVPCHRFGRFIRFNVAELAAATRSSGASIPSTDAASNGLTPLWPKSGLTNHGVARGVSRMSPKKSGRDAPSVQPRRNRVVTASLVEKRGDS